MLVSESTLEVTVTETLSSLEMTSLMADVTAVSIDEAIEEVLTLVSEVIVTLEVVSTSTEETELVDIAVLTLVDMFELTEST